MQKVHTLRLFEIKYVFQKEMRLIKQTLNPVWGQSRDNIHVEMPHLSQLTVGKRTGLGWLPNLSETAGSHALGIRGVAFTFYPPLLTSWLVSLREVTWRP